MNWTAEEESRIQALENDIAQLVNKVELNMVTKTEFHAKTLLLDRSIQELENSVEDLQSQITTLSDYVDALSAAYLGHGTGAVNHPPPAV